MSILKTLALSAVGLTFMTGAAFAADCKPSQWGADDEIGSANLVTPERTLAATKLIKQGKSVPLGIVIDSSTPAFPPRGLSLQVVQPNQQGGGRLFAYNGSYNDDLVQLWLGIGSQLDGLGHLGQDGMYYNCNDEKDFAALTGLKKMGTHNVPPLVGRGVVLNMAKHFGMESLPAGKFFTAADIQAASKAQGVEIREGDIVLFYTGWTDAKLESDPVAWASGEPGTSEDAAEWLASKNVMAVGADTWGVDVVPPEKEGRPFYGHVILLKEHGIYILETMNTGPLVRDGVTEFMFVLGQPRIRGTVQMIINPVALY
ncbi:MAG: cyclase family protein [Sneathiella sp.]|uniref:cyclase family protein n=1 Tax=Sneathiella sp. TaxID=1964365 RepID=UPI003002E572